MSVEINEKMTLSCKNVVLEVKNNSSVNAGKYVRLLNNISVDFKSGELNAIMGSSGGGKTTFINTFMGRVEPSSKSSGTIKLSDKERDINDWMKKTSYLEQDDYIISNQTVKEFILFATNCRRPDRSYKDNSRIVDDLIKKLGLSGTINVMLDNVSGGERKRVMIAVELAAEADILILDEPTTGLDSHKAIELIKFLKEYAMEKNKVVIVTIHQPGSGLFELFDKLLFISAGTKIYDGRATDVEQWLLDKGLEKPVKLSKPEFLFELFCGKTSLYLEINQGKPIVEKILSDAKEQADSTSKNAIFNGVSYPYINTSFNLKQSVEIFCRKLKLDFRNYAIYKKSLIFWFVLVLIAGLYYFLLSEQLENYLAAMKIANLSWFSAFKTLKDKLGNEGLIIEKYFIYILLQTSVIFQPLVFVNSVYDDKKVTERELKNNLYSIPSLIVGSIFYSTFNALIALIPILTYLCYLSLDIHSNVLCIMITLLGFIGGSLLKDAFIAINVSQAATKILMYVQLFILYTGKLDFVYKYGDVDYKSNRADWSFSYIFSLIIRHVLIISPSFFFNTFLYYSFVLNYGSLDFTNFEDFTSIEYKLLATLFFVDVEKNTNIILVRASLHSNISTFFSFLNFKYFALGMGGLVSMLYISIQALIIISQYAPRLRMKL